MSDLDEILKTVNDLKNQFTSLDEKFTSKVNDLSNQFTSLDEKVTSKVNDLSNQFFDLNIKVNTTIPLSRSQEIQEESHFGDFSDSTACRSDRKIVGYRFPTPY